MAYPAYNQAVNIPTDADTTGKWKALYAGTGGTVKVDTFGVNIFLNQVFHREEHSR